MLKRVLDRILILAIVSGCVIVLQKSFHFINATPFLNVDDSIANVAVSLAEHGRYGFLSSPTQGLYEVDRTHAFFNYGPLYFYVAAGLTWLMGPSLELFRMLHPLGLAGIVLAAVWLLRRVSLVGPGIFAVVLFQLYLDAHWPIARPDIMVSVCGVLMLVCAARAIERGGGWYWLGVGFFAVSAVTTHQIAAAMIPVAGVVWGWRAVAERGEWGAGLRRVAGVSLTALVLGGAAGALVYLLAIDFRLGDLWTLGSVGMKVYNRHYREALGTHLSYAWSSLSRGWLVLVALGFMASVVLAIGASFARAAVRRRALALVMPPVVAAILYQLSLGFYGNYHPGYAILSHVTTLWAVAATAAVSIAWAEERFGVWGGRIKLAAVVAAILLVGRADVAWARTSSMWQVRAAGNVDINDYVRQVLAPLPERAAVWGSLYFGLDAGDRTDLVQFIQLFQVVHDDFRPKGRSKVAPDFLALSNYELDIDAVRCLAGNETMVEDFAQLFPDVHYRLAHLVSAPPYGGTRVYERVPGTHGDPEAPLPGLAVNDGTGRQWSGGLKSPIEVKFSPVPPVVANVSLYAMSPERAAVTSLAADLPPGFFLIEARLESTDAGQTGVLLATPGRYFYWRGGWTDFSLPATPYLPGEKRVWLLVDHLGGPLYLSRFENPPAGKQAAPDFANEVFGRTQPRTPARAEPAAVQGHGMRILSVRRVSNLADEAGRVKEVKLPPWAQWSIQDPGVSVRPAADGVIRLAGSANPDSWLLESPPIPVPLNERLAFLLSAEPVSGGIEVGILGSTGSWLSPPTLMPRRIVFDTRESTNVRIVIANCSLGRTKPLDVALRDGNLAPTAPQLQYVDLLMGCRSPYIHLQGLACSKK